MEYGQNQVLSYLRKIYYIFRMKFYVIEEATLFTHVDIPLYIITVDLGHATLKNLEICRSLHRNIFVQAI